VVVGHEVRELVGGDAERDDERQVEEQLERRGGAVSLRRVASRTSAFPALRRVYRPVGA
jgi:hypothetical protein